jgi:antitoxin PrlF
MSTIFEAESSLTERYQTTVPESVRRTLRLGKRDKIRYTIRPDGDVVMSRVDVIEGDDPVMGQFLSFLARDFASHPERLASIDAGLAGRIQSLVNGVKIDLEAPLSEDDE